MLAYGVVGMQARQLFKDCQDARNCGYPRKERSVRSQMPKLTENCLLAHYQAVNASPVSDRICLSVSLLLLRR